MCLGGLRKKKRRGEGIEEKKDKDRKKAKVVASVRHEEFIQFLAALAVLPRTILNIRINCTRMI